MSVGLHVKTASGLLPAATVPAPPESDGSLATKLAGPLSQAELLSTIRDLVPDEIADDASAIRGELNTAFVHYGAIVVPGDTPTQIQAKADACAAAGTTLGIAAGTYPNIDAATIVFTGSVIADPNAVFSGNASPVVQVGNGTDILIRAKVVLPRVLRKTKNWGQAGGGPGAGVINTDIGVRVSDTRSCEIWVPHVQYFSIGLDVADNQGALYNKIFLGHLDNNAVNFRCTTLSVGGASNENNVYGGRYFHVDSEGTNVTGTRQIQMLKGSSAGPDNWHFWGGSLEGDIAEYIIECEGPENGFHGMRYEVTGTPRVKFSGANAQHNHIDGGYNADSIAVTQASGAAKNEVSSPGLRRRWQDSAGTDGALIIQNTTSSDYPILTGLPAAENPFGTGSNAPGTRYGFALSSQKLRGKQPADAYPRVEVDFPNGAVSFGDGTVTPAQTVTPYNSTMLRLIGSGLTAYPDATYDLGLVASRWRDAILSRDLILGRYIKIGNIYLRDNGGVLEKSTDATTWVRLNDDRGKFTPTLYGSTTPGSHTYTTQYGFYDIVGGMVFLRVGLRVNAAGLDAAMAGNLRIGGLPAGLVSARDVSAPAPVNFNYFNLGAGYTTLWAKFNTGNYIELKKNGTGIAENVLTHSDIGAGSAILIDFWATWMHDDARWTAL